MMCNPWCVKVSVGFCESREILGIYLPLLLFGAYSKDRNNLIVCLSLNVVFHKGKQLRKF